MQALIFNPNALAPTFPESAITKPFPFNAYYELDDAPEIDGKEWKLEVRGLVDNKKSWTLEELYKLPQVKQVTRHICVEGWSAIGSWTGTPLRDFLKLIGADTRAKYCWFQCADKDGYNSPLDMATALHPQTQMTFKFGDEILPRAYGYPDEDPGADKARIQESEIRDLDGSHQRLQGRLLGRPGLQFVQRELMIFVIVVRCFASPRNDKGSIPQPCDFRTSFPCNPAAIAPTASIAAETLSA